MEDPGEDRVSTVWMVSIKTGLQGRKGTLAMEGPTLIFRSASRRFGDTRIRLEEITRVRRARASPVLDLRLSSSTHPDRMGFYFVQPPDLDPSDGLHLRPRRHARRVAAQTMRRSNAQMKAEVEGWAREIEEAQRASGGPEA